MLALLLIKFDFVPRAIIPLWLNLNFAFAFCLEHWLTARPSLWGLRDV